MLHRSGPRPTHTPDGPLLQIGGDQRGPAQGMSVGGPRTGAGRWLPERYPPRLRARAGPNQWKPAPPRPVTNTIFDAG